MKKIMATLLATALLITLIGCGKENGDRSSSSDSSAPESVTPNLPDEKSPSPEGPPDLSGQWKQVNSEFEDSCYGAIIEDDVIEIYVVSNGGDTRSLYWSGTFEAPDTTEEPYSWESENDENRTSKSAMGSSAATKTFTYENGQITYSSFDQGTTTKVRLEKEEWDPDLEIGSNGTLEEAPSDFNEETNFDFVVEGVNFSLPLYYEISENQDDEMYYFIATKGDATMLFLGGIELPLEEYNAQKNSIADALISSFGSKREELLYSDTIDTAYFSWENIVFNIIETDSDINITHTLNIFYTYSEDTETFLVAVLTYFGNPKYDYIADYIKIIESATPIETTEKPSDTPTSLPANGIRPEFKQAMDDYEAFFDEYVAFMKKYSESDNTLGMLSDYATFMTRYTEAMEGLSEIGEQDLSKEELLYYTEVMGRINQKLISAAY